MLGYQLAFLCLVSDRRAERFDEARDTSNDYTFNPLCQGETCDDDTCNPL